MTPLAWIALTLGAVILLRLTMPRRRRRLPPNGTACRSHQDVQPDSVRWDWDAMRDRAKRRGIL